MEFIESLKDAIKAILFTFVVLIVVPTLIVFSIGFVGIILSMSTPEIEVMQHTQQEQNNIEINYNSTNEDDWG